MNQLYPVQKGLLYMTTAIAKVCTVHMYTGKQGNSFIHSEIRRGLVAVMVQLGKGVGERELAYNIAIRVGKHFIGLAVAGSGVMAC